jgi:hypothetical protein
MKQAFDWKLLVDDCGGATRAFDVIYAFKAELGELTAGVRDAIRVHSTGALSTSAERLHGALNAVNAHTGADLAAKLAELAIHPEVSPYPVWMKLCAEIGRIEAAMNGVDRRAA